MSNSNSLSQKGKAASENPMRIDLEVYFDAMDNIYHSKDNPTGTFPMNIAENQLCWEMLKEKMQEISGKQEIPDWVTSYGDPSGVLSFREAIASYYSDFLMNHTVDPETLALSVGATSVIEMTAFLLAEPGDTAVIPAPSYPVYTGDIGVFPSVKRYDLHTHSDIGELRDGIPLQISQLEKAKKEIEASGSKFRMLILTSPDNPTGGIYSKEQQEEIADWCIANHIHLIVNEIYGLSLIDTEDLEVSGDYGKQMKFYSFGNLMNQKKSAYLHHWYSFSKDLGISGFRIGVVHTYNEDFIQAYKNVGLSHGISNHTQWLLQEVLNDKAFMKTYIDSYQKALNQSYKIVRSTLQKLALRYSPSHGSLFVWMDLSEFLQEKTQQGENDLWLKVYEETKILLTPSNGFGHKQKGLFRLVISSFKHADLRVAMERFSKFVLQQRAGK